MFPVKDDWIYQIKEDLDVLGIKFDEEKIKNTKKQKFKQIVRQKLTKTSHSHLLEEKNRKLSKLDGLSNEYGMKEYTGIFLVLWKYKWRLQSIGAK